MRVSHLELYAHCKKIFQACGIPYGYAEEGAETVANAEFLGLYGLQQLADELPSLLSGTEEIDIIRETESLTVIDGGQQSGMLLGKACADYVIARLKDRVSSVVCVRHTRPSRVLAQQAMYLADQGAASMIIYQLPSHTSLIMASPTSTYPIMIHKRNNADMIEWITDHLGLEGGAALLMPKDNTEFCMFGTTSVAALDAQMNYFESHPDPSYVLTGRDDFEQRWTASWANGAEINQELWMELNATGNRMLVESTDQSRIRGAGELA